MCHTQFNNKEEVNQHINEKHSPNSFYEKLVEEISGTCQLCQKSFNPCDMKAHINSAHNDYQSNVDGEVEQVIEYVLNNIIDLSDSESEEQSETEEEEINIYNEYKLDKESSDESFKGKKPLFVQCVKSIKNKFNNHLP